MALSIHPYGPQHEDAVWTIIHAVVQSNDTYSYPSDMSRQEALAVWVEQPAHTFVAVNDENDEVVGTYYLKPNRLGNGSHVANAGFMVAPNARLLGVGKAMGRHAIKTAKEYSFVALQFNFVVSTNTVAIRLWQSLGFEIVATLPKAFNHGQLGLVDAHVMYLLL